MGGDGEAHKNPTYLHHLLLLTPDNDKTHFEKGLVCSAISLFSDIGRTCTRLITILLDLSITWGGGGSQLLTSSLKCVSYCGGISSSEVRRRRYVGLTVFLHHLP